MTTSPSSPIIPHPEELDLSDDQVRALQRILQNESGSEVSFEEAEQRGLELLRLALMLLDPAGSDARTQAPPVRNPEIVAVPPPPAPEMQWVSEEQSLQSWLNQLAKDLPLTRRRPTQWRWVVTSLWKVLAGVLADHRPAGVQLDGRPGEVPRLFRAVARERPELPQVEESIELLDELHAKWLRVGVTRWPVRLTQLPGIVQDCVRVIQRLEPGLAMPISDTVHPG